MTIEKLTVFAETGDKNTDDLMLGQGFPSKLQPARQWMNWLFNKITLKINEVIDGKLGADDNAVSATKLKYTRKIGGVDFDGSAEIDLPGVNIAGNQSTTGNAATAAKLQTARKINGVNFDGSSDINVDVIRIGTISWHLGNRPSVWAGDLTLDGQLVNRADYAELWNLVNSGRFASIDDSTWIADPSQRGSYSTGNGTTTFRLPDLNGIQDGSIEDLFLRGSKSASAGTVLGDAIRNITGSLGSIRTANTNPPLTGGFYLDGAEGSNTRSITGSGGTAYRSIGFDSSLSVPTSTENRPKSVFGIWVVSVKGSHVVVPSSSNTATLTGGNTFDGSQSIIGDIHTTGTLQANTTYLQTSNLQVVTGTDYTITYDYSTRLAHIQMRVFTNKRIYLGLPQTDNKMLNYKDVTLPIVLKKRIHTEAFFTTVDAVNIGQMDEAYEWLWWTPPAGIDGTTDSKVRISARRWMGSADEFCHCDLYVTGYF